MRDATFPVVLIMLGLAWLLHSLDLLPRIQWLWIIGLSGSGLAILILDGITKSSVVAGPLLIVAGVMAFCRQYYGLAWRIIIPVMLITAGLTMLVARSPAVPESRELARRAGRGNGERRD